MHLFSRQPARFLTLPPYLLASLLFFLPCSRTSAQSYNPVIDVQHYDFSLALNDDSNNIRGTAVITVLFRTNATQFILDLTAKNSSGKGMTVLSITENNQPVTFSQDSAHLTLQTHA